ncbi:hypothetical protein GCM10023094_10460 [Rhodococcus olei]|uniref:7-cyano-7-deazaguanine synthase in queuosine biosynthesis n=1 Tax=Rhodococcus olei TaxID=2161675 RepID=A0ABP8NW91_9NOCA
MSSVVTVRPRAGGPNEAGAEVSWGSETFVVEESANVSLYNSATAWLAPGLAIAMEHAMPLRIDGEVDAQALSTTGPAQDLLVSWWPEKMTRISIDAPTTTEPARDGRGVGCFFSGGVDSFYSVVANQSEITHLVFVHGFDIFLNNQKYYERTLADLRRAAADLGKELIEVRTNIRHLYEGYRGGWDLGHGVALAHVALLLSEHLHTVLVPASHAESNLEPYGTHPELDPLWSSSATSVVYDGLEATRVMKAQLIKNSDAAMRNLRVCWWNRTDRKNCGECEKCVRTAINMRIAGAGDRCTALPAIDPVRALPRVVLDEESGLFFVRENLDAMRAAGVHDPELEAALEQALQRGAVDKLRAQFWQGLVVGKVLSMSLRERLAERLQRA